MLALFFSVGLHHCAFGNREITIFPSFSTCRTADRHKQPLSTFHATTQLPSLILILLGVLCSLSDCEVSFSSSCFEYFSTFSCLFSHVARIKACSDTTVALAARPRTGTMASLYPYACRISFCVSDSCFLCSLRQSGSLRRVFALVLEFVDFARVFSFSVVVIDTGTRF